MFGLNSAIIGSKLRTDMTNTNTNTNTNKKNNTNTIYVVFGQNGAIIGSKVRRRGMTPISAAHLFSKTITSHGRCPKPLHCNLLIQNIRFLADFLKRIIRT